MRVQKYIFGVLCVLCCAVGAVHAHSFRFHTQTSISVDFDGSGTVDFPDFIAFAAAFGKSADGDNAKFDLDSSGAIDFGDFLVFATSFGQASGSTGDTTTEPENTFGNEVTITTQNNLRVIRSNGLPDHETGAFPNSGNPHSISEQSIFVRVPLNPEIASTATSVLGSNNRPAYKAGIAINGIEFDPTTAEFWRRDASLGWNIEAIGGTLNLGLDQNEAHVQPTGQYHYHGIPWGLTAKQDTTKHSTLYGYAADGFPIYIVYGTSDPADVNSVVRRIKSSYQLKSGARPSDGPSGNYDGTYTQDYDYVAGSGDLDECNGRFGITPDYPDGIYHYFITDTFPFQLRCFKGTPNGTFRLGPP